MDLPIRNRAVTALSHSGATLATKLNMTPQQRHDRLRHLATQLIAIHTGIRQISEELTLDCDVQAVERILVDLVWAAEDCSTIARHQIGKAVNDSLGFSAEDPVK